MEIDQQALTELLERAASLEEKAAALLEDAPPATDGTAILDQIAARIQSAEEQIMMLTSSAPGVDPVADYEAGDDEDEMDFPPEVDDPFETGAAEEVEVPADLEPKADFDVCPKCGSKDADEYADGTARCADCGEALSPKEGKTLAEVAGFDFDLETKGDELTEELDEIELLLARRAQL